MDSGSTGRNDDHASAARQSRADAGDPQALVIPAEAGIHHRRRSTRSPRVHFIPPGPIARATRSPRVAAMLQRRVSRDARDPPARPASPPVNLEPTPATPRPSSFPRRRESIPFVVRHALLECTSSPGPGRPRNPFTPSSADASTRVSRCLDRARGPPTRPTSPTRQPGADAGDARALVIPVEAGIHPRRRSTRSPRVHFIPRTRSSAQPVHPEQRRCFSGAYRGARANLRQRPSSPRTALDGLASPPSLPVFATQSSRPQPAHVSSHDSIS